MSGQETIQADYVVVGSGSAGATLAWRLADTGSSVAVIEAGGSDRSPIFRKPGAIVVAHSVPQLKKTIDWGHYTVPQKNALGRKIPMTHGKVLGGSSSVNGMIYVRGNRDNYDSWAAEGNTGWSYDDLLPLMKRMESFEDSGNEYRGSDGPINVTRIPDPRPAVRQYIDAATETLGVPFNNDYNAESQFGISVVQQSAKDGLRNSTSEVFLRQRPLSNLQVHTGLQVTKVVIKNGAAVGVEGVNNKGRTIVVRASREVIVSAGAFGSPHLLQLSGIGPADHLRGHGITVHADLPVGDNLHDHLFTPMGFVMPSAINKSTAGNFAKGFAMEFIRGKTWLANTVFESTGFVRTSHASSSDAPNLQLLVLPWQYPSPNQDSAERLEVDPRPGLTVMPTLIYPKSRGTVRLASANPFEAPLIDPHYFEEEYDREVLFEGCMMARDIMSHSSIAKHVEEELHPGPDVHGDDLRDALRNRITTVYHPVGSCRMGVDDNAVVGPDLKVHGVDRLRVADASIMPSITGGNTNVPSILIGEKAASLIIEGA